MPSGTGRGYDWPITIKRLPSSSRLDALSFDGSASDPASFGAEPVTSTARTVSPCSEKIVEPSVLTMSGSSTPCSWLLVVEYAAPAPDPLVPGAPGAEPPVGALVATGPGPLANTGAPARSAPRRCHACGAARRARS